METLYVILIIRSFLMTEKGKTIAGAICTIFVISMARGFVGEVWQTLFYPFIAVIVVGGAIVWGINKYARENRDSDAAKGVGGWLLFYVVVSFLGIAIDIFIDIRNIAEALPGTLSWKVLYIIVFGIFRLSVLISLLLIVRLHKQAVRVSKALLVVRLLIFALYPVIYLLSIEAAVDVNVLSHETISFMYDIGNIRMIIGNTLFSIIWYLYFVHAKRVKNTWPDSF